MKNLIRIYVLSVKYWLQGDRWNDAKKYAKVIVYGFKTVNSGGK